MINNGNGLCRDCRWWDIDPVKYVKDSHTKTRWLFGKCKRHSPFSCNSKEEFPFTVEYEWCGDFKERQEND